MGEVVQFPDKIETAEARPEGIPENAVGVGGTVPPAEPQPQETVKITVTGILNKLDAQPVENHMELTRAQGAANGESIAFVWSRIRALGGLVFDDSENKVTFFPLEAFEKITMEVSPVVGVTL